ncbi:MAG: hypothetical protein RIC18_06060 [Hoeflea sp.]|uniref:hypothetical protein n=1 Tax=Hoeflea sp. TaxID=1940281 RepID=UPI0032EF1755
MKRLMLIALAGAFLLPVPAEAERLGRRLDAIQSGRLYDPLLSPQLNPSFEFQPNAEARFLYDLRKGRVGIDEIPEGQRRYFQMQIEQSR